MYLCLIHHINVWLIFCHVILIFINQVWPEELKKTCGMLEALTWLYADLCSKSSDKQESVAWMHNVKERHNTIRSYYNSSLPWPTWWGRDMDTLSTLLALCAGNPPVADGFLAYMMRSWLGHNFHITGPLCRESTSNWWILGLHDEVVTWTHFPHYWPFVQGIHQ